MDIAIIIKTIIITMTILMGAVVIRFSHQDDINILMVEVMQRHDCEMDFYLLSEDYEETATLDESVKEQQAAQMFDLITTRN